MAATYRRSGSRRPVPESGAEAAGPTAGSPARHEEPRRDMPARRLEEMTWEEVRDLPIEDAVAVLPIGALEAHGPHLPIATDVIIAEAMTEAGARRLEAEGVDTLLLPTLRYTSAGFAAAFPGTVHVSSGLVADLLVEVARSLASHGVALLALANAHLDPDHLASVRAAVERIEEEGDVRVAFPDVTRRRLAGRLTEEFRSGACHAGRYEGSIVLAARPDRVRRERAEALAPNPASLVEAIRGGASTFGEAGGPDAYFGWPADATADEGRETIDELGRMLAEAVLEARA